MFTLQFTLLEFILLFWFIAYAVVLIVYELDGNYKLKITDALVLLVFLPFVIAFGFIYAIYEITIGKIVKLAKDKKRYEDAYKEVQETVDGLQKKLEELNKPNVEVGPNE